MKPIHEVRDTLKSLFDGKIDVSDRRDRPDREQEDTFLSRALSAYALHYLADLDTDRSALCVVDGYDDNGIDAVHFHGPSASLWVVQAKWSNKGTGGPDLAEIKKYVDGIRDLVNCRWERFNQKLQDKRDELEAALDDHHTCVKVVLAYSGTQLSSHAKREFADLLAELRDTSDRNVFVEFNLQAIIRSMTEPVQKEGVQITLRLNEWGKIEKPHQAFYGYASSTDIAKLWQVHGQGLASKNIRRFLGDNTVNEAVQRTLRDEPSEFWYFNNGITIVCSSVQKSLRWGDDRTRGDFYCEGASIVNGAQTVGNIGETYSIAPDQVDHAYVHVRLISLKGCPDRYGDAITRATNTQTRIEKRDFVSLDPQQSRLRTELHRDGIRYVYRTGDSPLTVAEEGCTLEEATAALACSSNDIQAAIWSKKEIGRLWDDIGDQPYTTLFNPDLSGKKLWRLIQVQRAVESRLKPSTLHGDVRNIAVHGNRLIAFMVFQALPAASLSDSSHDIHKVLKQASFLADVALEETRIIVQRDFPKAMVGRLFYNVTNCRKVFEDVRPVLAVRDDGQRLFGFD